MHIKDKIDKYLEVVNEASDKWAKFENMLKNHDWYYSMSSDYRAYQAGKKQWEDIRKLKDELETEDKDRTRYIFYKYIDDYSDLRKDLQSEYKKLKKKFE